jgi:hypothetical protein
MTTGDHRAVGPASGGDVPAQTTASPREAAEPPQLGWVPDGVDITVPVVSRVYNRALGGRHNFEVDRELWSRIEHSYPPARSAAQANRAFLARATRWLAGLGVRQYLDIGAGIPTLDATHETARETDPTARVVYVDIDPVAVEQAESMLAGDPNARAIRGDLREPERILTDPVVTALLDFSAPVAVLLGYVLQHIPNDADAAAPVSRIGAALFTRQFPGSLPLDTRGDGGRPPPAVRRVPALPGHPDAHRAAHRRLAHRAPESHCRAAPARHCPRRPVAARPRGDQRSTLVHRARGSSPQAVSHATYGRLMVAVPGSALGRRRSPCASWQLG